MNVTKAQALIEQIVEEYAFVFADFEPADCIRELDEISRELPYNFVTEALQRRWEAILDRHGADGLGAFNKVTLLQLISQHSTRCDASRPTDDIQQCFERSHQRVLTAIEDPEFDAYNSTGDILLKDLAIGRHKMFPAGAQLVEPHSCFHRALLVRGGPRQALRMIRLMLKTGGHQGWYQIHTHPLELSEFNPDGWNVCYARIAGMLERHRDCKGMWGGSWFYDPALAQVSPRLAYLREIPTNNGAELFYSNEDTHGGALATSKTRRALHESGKYNPKSYALIWPRDAMIRWAQSYSPSDENRIS